MDDFDEIISLDENSSSVLKGPNEKIELEQGQEQLQLQDSPQDYIEVLNEIKKNPIPFIGLMWKIIEKNNVNLNTLLLKDMETFKEEQVEILENKSKNDYDFSNFQIPALTNYSNWSRLLMDFLFKTYNINSKGKFKKKKKFIV